jgi:hypothetical protein
MNAEMTQRRCGIDEVFASPFIELITLAPRNAVVRGLILAQTGKMPGDERMTFEEIKEWVETTCDKPSRPPKRGSAREAITVTVEFSETECGRASYSVPRSGREEFALDENELIEMVQEAIDDGKGLDGVIERVVNLIDDEGWDRCEPVMDDYGDYDYENHECDNTNNSSIEASNSQIRERLLVFLQANHPGLLEELS